jgi:hydrogenase expression/formation protein HypE
MSRSATLYVGGTNLPSSRNAHRAYSRTPQMIRADSAWHVFTEALIGTARAAIPGGMRLSVMTPTKSATTIDDRLAQCGVSRRAFLRFCSSLMVAALFTIGDLAINGTVNDLAMCGARPLALSAGFVLEEGLSLAMLDTVVAAMRDAARAANVSIVTGDTKVLDKGKGDGLFVNTAGIGCVVAPTRVGPGAIRPGDAVIVSGDLGRHGIAVLSVRDGLAFDGDVTSDTAPLWPAIEALFDAGITVHCLRDLTRGGLSSALNEIASAARLSIDIDEMRIPVTDVVRGACELLGLDPLYVANEGRFAAFVPEADASRALEVLRAQPVASGAVVAGIVRERPAGVVTLRTRVGGARVLDMLSGEQLPRIC